MKIISLILFMLSALTVQGQVPAIREQHQLIGLGLELNQLKLDDIQVQHHLQDILKKERKRKLLPLTIKSQ